MFIAIYTTKAKNPHVRCGVLYHNNLGPKASFSHSLYNIYRISRTKYIFLIQIPI